MKEIVLILSCLSLFSCSSVNRLNTKAGSNDSFFMKFNNYAYQRSALIILTDGQERKGRNLRVLSGKLIWEDDIGEHRLSIDSLYKIQFVNRGKGAMLGLTNGALVGFGVGAIAGLLDSGDFFTEPAAAAMILGIFGSFWGAATGLLVGVIVGHSEIYMFSPDEIKVASKIQTQGSSHRKSE